jgi:hypothetical protein
VRPSFCTKLAVTQRFSFESKLAIGQSRIYQSPPGPVGC